MSKKRDAEKPEPPRSEAEQWLDLLPKPPQPLHAQDEIGIAAWMRECAERGGHAALLWLHQPANWPFTKDMRMRTLHIRTAIWRELEEEAKRKAEHQQRELEAKRVDTDRELKRARGWA